jgi:hypothetical protein
MRSFGRYSPRSFRAGGACASATGQISCQPERLRGTSMRGDLQDQFNGVVQADAPSRVHHDRSSAAARAHPAGDNVGTDPHKAGGATAVYRPGTLAGERPVCDADRRELEDGTQVGGEAGSPRVVGSGGVDKQNIG